MSHKNNTFGEPTDREIVITRDFAASREAVWNAWTRPEQIAQWWGPRGFSTKVPQLDLRNGGSWSYIMTGPDGTEYPVNGVFLEVVPHERLVTTDEFGDGFQHQVESDLPHGIVLTAFFDDLGGKTRVTLRIAHPTPEDRQSHEDMGVVPGWNSSLDCLAEYFAKQ